MNILIVEDDILTAKSIESVFNTFPDKMIITIISTYEDAEESVFGKKFDLAIIDIFLGDSSKNGLDLCSLIRDRNKNLPIIIITAHRPIQYLETAFLNGVNDYLIKPFHPTELKIRAEKCLYSQYKSPENKQINYNELRFLIEKNHFFYLDNPIHLTKKCKALLLILIKEPEKVLDKYYIQEKLWSDYDPYEKNRNLRSNIQLLKKSLDKRLSSWIRTIRGEGYMLIKPK